MTCRCKLARDLRPEPWYGERPIYAVLAILFPALATAGYAYLFFVG